MRGYGKLILVILLALLLVFTAGCRGSRQGDEDAKPPGTNGEPGEEGEGNGEGDETGEEPDEGEPISEDTPLVVSGDNLALRKSPGAKNKEAGDVLTRLKQGSKVFLQDHHGNGVKMDGFIWWEVYDPAAQVKGWSAAQYLLYPDALRTATLEGSITFPSSHIPPGFVVVAEDVVTGQEYKTNKVLTGSKYKFGVGFKIKVPPGDYHIFATEPNAPTFKAYYDEYMQREFTGTDYGKILVSVVKGDLVDDILVGNWWRPGYH
jgi:hypothetical protein